MRKKHLTMAAFMLIVQSMYAQQNDPFPVANSMFGFNWEISIPTNDFVTKTSPGGFSMEFRKLVKNNFSLGFDITWNAYSQYEPRHTHEFTNGAITGDIYKYLYTLPLAINAQYYFFRSKWAMLYAALGIGAVYSEQKIYYNAFIADDCNWGFLVRPEAGAIIRPSLKDKFAFLLGIRYSNASNRQDNLQISGLTAVGFRIGVVGYY